jgi:hypothetical protein
MKNKEKNFHLQNFNQISLIICQKNIKF